MKVLKLIKNKLDRLDEKALYGAGQDILRPKKTDNPLIDSLKLLYYYVVKSLDWLDTKFIFKKRTVRTKKGRVRSRVERKLAHFFEKYHIDYIYEQTLILGDVKLHPDFYLSEYEVYVELWGLANEDKKYRRIMGLKRKLYRKHNIPVISVYPRHLKDLEKSFPVLFKKTTGQEFSQTVD